MCFTWFVDREEAEWVDVMVRKVIEYIKPIGHLGFQSTDSLRHPKFYRGPGGFSTH